MPLSQSDVEQFYDQDYLIVRNVFQDADFLPLETAYNSLIDCQARFLLDQHRITSLYENENFSNRLALISNELADEHFKDFRKFLFNFNIKLSRPEAMFDFFFNTKLLKAVEKIIGEEVTLHPTFNFRPYVPARKRGQFLKIPWHQDGFMPNVNSDIVITWIPLVNVSPENGGLQIIPNVKNLLHHTVTNTYDYIEDNNLPPAAQVVDIVMERGDILFMTGLTPHRGLANQSPGVRWSIDLRFSKTKPPTERTNPFEMIVQSAQESQLCRKKL